MCVVVSVATSVGLLWSQEVYEQENFFSSTRKIAQRACPLSALARILLELWEASGWAKLKKHQSCESGTSQFLNPNFVSGAMLLHVSLNTPSHPLREGTVTSHILQVKKQRVW